MPDQIFFEKKPSLNITVMFLLFVVIALSPKIDIYISTLFFQDGHFVLENNCFFNFVDKGLPEIIVGFSVLVFLLWAVGYINSKKWILGANTKNMQFICGSMLLGPLLIVNGLFKSFWGRARPMNIIEFGGDKIFSPAMVISNQCHLDCSFVSGHTSVGFWLIALALLMPIKYRRKALIFTFILGALFGLVRIAQGYHFFSDVFFSAVITIYAVWFMYYIVYIRNISKKY